MKVISKVREKYYFKVTMGLDGIHIWPRFQPAYGSRIRRFADGNLDFEFVFDTSIDIDEAMPQVMDTIMNIIQERKQI